MPRREPLTEPPPLTLAESTEPQRAQAMRRFAVLKPRPSVATLRRRLLKVAKERHWTVPSYASIYRIVRRLDPGMVTLAHEGHAGYREQFELLHRFRAEKPKRWRRCTMENAIPCETYSSIC